MKSWRVLVTPFLMTNLWQQVNIITSFDDLTGVNVRFWAKLLDMTMYWFPLNWQTHSHVNFAMNSNAVSIHQPWRRFSCRLTLAAYYRLAQSILKICFGLAKQVGLGGGQAYSRHAMHMTAVTTCHMAVVLVGCKQTWSALAGPFQTLIFTTCHAHGSCLGWL